MADPSIPNFWLTLLKFLISVGLVYIGSEWVVESAAALAIFMGISAAVIGLTIISIGTSIPEAATSMIAASKGFGGVSVGNIIGSDLAQITMILGICAMIRPIFMKKEEVQRDGSIMLIAATLGVIAMLTTQCTQPFTCVVPTYSTVDNSQLICDDRGEELRIEANYTLETIDIPAGFTEDGMPAQQKKASLSLSFITAAVGEANIVCESETPDTSLIAFKKEKGCSATRNGTGTLYLTCGLVNMTYLSNPASDDDPVLFITAMNEEGKLSKQKFICTKKVVSGKKRSYMERDKIKKALSGKTGSVNRFTADIISSSCVTRWEGGVLALLYCIYLIYLFRTDQAEEEEEMPEMSKTKAMSLLVIGFIFVLGGSELLVSSARDFAIIFDVPKFIIGMTMIAFGTSLPELVISAMAAYKGEEEMSLGNLIGSNITDPLFSMGFGASIGGNILVNPGLVYSHGVYMLFCSAVALFLMWRSGMVSRRSSVILMLLYLFYLPIYAL